MKIKLYEYCLYRKLYNQYTLRFASFPGNISQFNSNNFKLDTFQNKKVIMYGDWIIGVIQKKYNGKIKLNCLNTTMELIYKHHRNIIDSLISRYIATEFKNLYP